MKWKRKRPKRFKLDKGKNTRRAEKRVGGGGEWKERRKGGGE